MESSLEWIQIPLKRCLAMEMIKYNKSRNNIILISLLLCMICNTSLLPAFWLCLVFPVLTTDPLHCRSYDARDRICDTESTPLAQRGFSAVTVPLQKLLR